MSNGQVLFVTNQEKDNAVIANHVLEMVDELSNESSEKDIETYETAFLITPNLDLDFEDFYELTQAIQQILDNSHPGRFVLVAFHPEFRYQEQELLDTANATNKSPHPMIHILKESSLTYAAQSADIEQLVNRNKEILSAMSWDSIKRLSHPS